MKEIIEKIIKNKYEPGFITKIKSDTFKPGLNENIVKELSYLKSEPEFMMKFRLTAYKYWLTLKEPKWSLVKYPKIDFNNISYYSKPKNVSNYKKLSEIEPEILKTYDKLGISLTEQKKLSGIAVDAVFDSTSIITTHKKSLEKLGIIFCSMSEAIKEHPELIKKYLGIVIPYSDNYYAALNSAVFTDGSFCFIPSNTHCPIDLSTYFRINEVNTGQFERTLIIAEQNSSVNYLEGCSAPIRNDNQLHAAVVELIAKKNAKIKYSTVQNWYPGNKIGKGGIYNFVTKRGLCLEENSNISWIQIETGSSITWKYPSVVLKGDNSVGEFYSIAFTNNYQQADTGTKMIHIGKNTRSTIISKGISAGFSTNIYRGLVKINDEAINSKNYTQCDSLIINNKSIAHTYPYIEVDNPNSIVEHEATTGKISEEQLFYCIQRGFNKEEASILIVNGFCKTVFKKLPMEFAIEAQKLIEINLENSIA
jgi:Fe-S cluster assembly protein SufB